MSKIEDGVDEVVEATGADRGEVRESLENLIVYSVPLDEAIESVKRKYTSSDFGSAEHDTPTCPGCGGNRTRPLDDTIATCFDCDEEWVMS